MVNAGAERSALWVKSRLGATGRIWETNGSGISEASDPLITQRGRSTSWTSPLKVLRYGVIHSGGMDRCADDTSLR
jgi:hypothetical protein